MNTCTIATGDVPVGAPLRGADAASFAPVCGADEASFAPRPDREDSGESDHFVQFFEQDDTLLQSLSSYLAAGLDAGDACIVVATPSHEQGLRRRLTAFGYDVTAAISAGRIVFLDAATNLESLMTGNRIDPARFRERIGALLDSAQEGHAHVRIFGEMVALLWERGLREEAIALEQLWNTLGTEHSFSLFCAYPIREFCGTDAARAFREVCASHGRVLSPEGDSGLHADVVQSLIEWQHKARLLEREIDQRKKAESALRQTKDELEQQIEDLRRLHELSHRLTGIRDVKQLLQEVLIGALAVQGADKGLLLLRDDENEGLTVKVQRGFGPDSYGEYQRGSSGTGACGACFSGRRRVVVEDTQLNPASFCEAARESGCRACHSTPLITRGDSILGVLAVHYAAPHRASDREMWLMDLFAQMAADSIENANLHRQSQRELEERQQLLKREQQARAESEQANLLKDEFLSTVSHELRTPLTAIMGWAHMLRYETLDDELTAQAVETIERAATSQAQLVEDMLDVSRMISGKLRLNSASVDPAAVVRAAVDAVELAAKSKAIRLSLIVSPAFLSGRVRVLGDASRLQQVVWNLISNAIKFTPQGGRVDVRLERGASFVRIKVIDTGEGIAAEFMPYLFDRFRQADGSSTRRHGGLGLGLALVRHLVELHGGTVRADSPGTGAGSTFTVRLPAIPARGKGIRRIFGRFSAAGGRAGAAVLHGVQVLLVDRDQDALRMMRAMLEGQKAEVRTARGASEAFKILERFRPNVLVCDLTMPDDEGYALIARLRGGEEPGARHVPAVALTAQLRVEDRRRALEAGFQMFVPKPVELDELLTTVSSLAVLGA